MDIAGGLVRSGADGKAEFLYWNAADALCRTAQYWAAVVPQGTVWHAEVGGDLTAHLDDGIDLNAYYDREGLWFYHRTVSGVTVYSAESPGIVSHEMGHAVLDAIQPQLFDAASAEVAAFHEAFGDISALLTALQMDSLCVAVLTETSERVARSSQVSRIAEQLGWAIRQNAPAAVEPDCLRNAANRFFYAPPAELDPDAPATMLSSRPHSFSRVFTGAFLRFIAGVYEINKQKDSEGLSKAGEIAGDVLMEGVQGAPVVPAYFAEVAAHMIAADKQLHEGKYGSALNSALIRHGLLSPGEAVSVAERARSVTRRDSFGVAGAGTRRRRPLGASTIEGATYGLAEDFTVRVPTEQSRFSVTGAAPDRGAVALAEASNAAASFVEDLFRQGQVEVSELDWRDKERQLGPHGTRKSHEIVRDAESGSLSLVRRHFE